MSVLRTIVMLTAALATAGPAFAQLAQPTLRQGRPSRGLFGGGNGETGQQLVFNAAIGGGYDWDEGGVISGGPGAPTTPAEPWNGKYGSGTARLSYSLSRERVSAGASIGGSARYNPSVPDSLVKAVGANAQISFQVTSRTALSASQGISHQPFNIQRLQGAWFGADSAPPAFLGLSGVGGTGSQFNSQSAVSLSQSITSRIALSAGVSYQAFNGWNAAPDTGSKTTSASFRASYSIFKGARIGAGYGYTSSRFGSAAPVTSGGPAFDGGLSFDRAISLTRRTSFSFATGVSGAKNQTSKTYYFLTGNASLNHEIGRSWTASLSYRRGVDFNQGFSAPVVLDRANAGVSGVIGRRLTFSAGGGASWGALGVGPGARDFTVASGSINLQTALTQALGISVGYSYNQYKFDDPSSLPAGLRPEMERQGVSISLDLFVPLIVRAKR